MLTSQSSWSLCCSRGSKLVLTVPRNKVGSWGIIPSLDLKSCRPILEMCTPSISIHPSKGSTTRKRACTRVDFPLPVLPTIPIFFCPGKTQVTPLRTIGAAGSYCIWRLWSSIFPSLGHSGSGLQSWIINGASLGMLENCNILSTDIILFSTLQRFHITQAWSTFKFNP